MNKFDNIAPEDEDNVNHCEREVTLEVEDFLALNGDDYDAETEAKQRKASDWFLLAARSYVHDEFDLAITYFDKVLELEPENAKAYANRADVYTDQGHYEEAYNDYLMAAHLGGDPAQALLDEFVQEMQAKKIMNEDRQFVVTSLKAEKASYLKTVSESELGEDMHIIDPDALDDDDLE